MRVLLIEDDAAVRLGIETMLKSEGMVIDTTDLGEDGLEIAKLYDYDIVLLDLMLPDMDGMELLRRLRDARVLTPVLILSGLAQAENKVRGLGGGADDYLTKPFDKRELIARIHAIVRRSKGHAQPTIEPELKIVDVFICKLRKKLATATEGEHYIETVWGRGYVLRDPRADRGEHSAVAA